MLGMHDPNSLGLLLVFMNKDKIFNKKPCQDMDGYEKEKSGCRCNEYEKCQEKVSKWPNLLDLFLEIRRMFSMPVKCKKF